MIQASTPFHFPDILEVPSRTSKNTNLKEATSILCDFHFRVNKYMQHTTCSTNTTTIQILLGEVAQHHQTFSNTKRSKSLTTKVCLDGLYGVYGNFLQQEPISDALRRVMSQPRNVRRSTGDLIIDLGKPVVTHHQAGRE